MLTISATAAQAIESIIAAEERAGEDAGIRIFTQEPAAEGQVALAMGIAPGPMADDQVVVEEGARVFLPPDAAVLLEDKVLDTRVEGDNLAFEIVQQT